MKRAAWLGAAVLLVAIAWHIGRQIPRGSCGACRGCGISCAAWCRRTSGVLPAALVGAVGTIEIALLGTRAGRGAGDAARIPLGAQRRPAAVYYAARAALNFFRSIDTLVYALLFVAAVGLGPFPGDAGRGRVHDDVPGQALLGDDRGDRARPVDAIRATGATRLQVLRFGVLPQVLPLFLSYVLYRFESNVRAATVLGFVGAGGIGLLPPDLPPDDRLPGRLHGAAGHRRDGHGASTSRAPGSGRGSSSGPAWLAGRIGYRRTGDPGGRSSGRCRLRCASWPTTS